MVFIQINNKNFFVKKNSSILEACNFIGITIPRFCYHESLSVAGNCRMCLVEIEPNVNLKPVSACTLIVSEGGHILTNSPFVKKARENVLESLLLNHPLDCPICDQGGECDLQDQAFQYGATTSRFFLKKRAVEDKNLGFFIKSIMTRCIHCTRCVRFSHEVAGVKLLGTLSRGQKTEIGTYKLSVFKSNISGNVVDLCPVGALTSRLYAFKAKPWELATTESIDLTDSIGCNIFVSVKQSNIVRIIPKKKKSLNNFFISDKARYSFDALTNLRLLESFWKQKTWTSFNLQFLFSYLTLKLKSVFNLFIIPENLDYQNLVKLVHLEKISGCKIQLCVSSGISYSIKNLYLNNQRSTIVDFEKNFKLCYVLSSNLKLENIILNIKIRTKFLKSRVSLFSSGFSYSTNFPNCFVTLNVQSLFKIFEGKLFLSLNFMEEFCSWFIVGNSLSARFSSTDIFNFFKKIFPKSNFLNLQKYSNSESIAFLNIKYLNTNLLSKSQNLLGWCLEDNLVLHKIFHLFKKKIFWINSHSPHLANKTNFMVPTLTFFESDGVFLNFEGNCQKAYASILNPNKNIVKLAFFFSFFIRLYTNQRQKLKSPFFFFIEMTNKFGNFNKSYYNHNLPLISLNFFMKHPLKSSFEDFYQTDAFTKSSLNMFKRSKEIRKTSTNFFSNN